jgi:hypothetical protein
MALALENQLYVWQKVEKTLDAMGASKGAYDAFSALFSTLTSRGITSLQFVPFTAEQAVTAAGIDMCASAATVYGMYAKGRRTSGTTSSFLDVHAAATDAATTTTILSFRFKATGQRHWYTNDLGMAFETGCLYHSATAVGGTVDSSAADSADGFFILGS